MAYHHTGPYTPLVNEMSEGATTTSDVSSDSGVSLMYIHVICYCDRFHHIDEMNITVSVSSFESPRSAIMCAPERLFLAVNNYSCWWSTSSIITTRCSSLSATVTTWIQF